MKRDYSNLFRAEYINMQPPGRPERYGHLLVVRVPKAPHPNRPRLVGRA